MYHERFQKTHFEAGFQWGMQLFQEGRHLLDLVPFPVTEERVRFAEACRPYYETWYPQVLDEIRGIAEGQQTEPRRLEDVLFSMYCILP